MSSVEENNKILNDLMARIDSLEAMINELAQMNARLYKEGVADMLDSFQKFSFGLKSKQIDLENQFKVLNHQGNKVSELVGRIDHQLDRKTDKDIEDNNIPVGYE
jgi:hypothetical protein